MAMLKEPVLIILLINIVVSSAFSPSNIPSNHNLRYVAKLYCVAKDGALNKQLQAAIDYVCHKGTDCRRIESGQSCYLPNNLSWHASVVLNLYYRNHNSQEFYCKGMAAKTMYGSMMNEKLDGTNYDIWHRKIQYLLNECGTEETLTVVLAEPKDKSAASYQQDLDKFQEWAKRDRSARYTMLNCMHNDLIGEFESCPNAKDMWDKLKVSYGQTSATRLRALNLKWMQYTMDPNHGVAEHLRVMSAMIRDLKAAGREVSEEEQVLNVIRSLPNEPEHWQNFKLLMAHSEHVRSFTEISRHLEMEVERQKTLGIPNVALVAKASTSKNKKSNRGKGKKGQHNSQSHGPKGKDHKTKGRKEKNKARQKCYNCKKKGHYRRECPELNKTQEQAST